MSRIKRGWALTKKSAALLNEHRELVRFPLYGGIATIVLGLLFLGPGAFALDKHTYGIGIPLIVIGIYVLSVVGIYFSVGLAACADLIFRGEQATVGDGMAVANARFVADLRLGGALDRVRADRRPAGEPGRRLRRDRRPPGRHRLVPGHLPLGAGDRDRGHRPSRHAETLRLALQSALGTADHRQHRDRRRRLPARLPPRRALRRGRRRDLALGRLRGRRCWS